MYYWQMPSPVGKLFLAGDEDGLCMLNFQKERHPACPEPGWKRNYAPFRNVIAYLEGYFRGQRPELDIPLVLNGTSFQLTVWSALTAIPYGETRSYGEVAHAIRKPRAARAVGAAVGKNPIPILIPCHRVIGSTGSLTGFGGGLDVKRILLAIEASRN
ncbi:methylated-DNA--protein-cysteine methyltransferase [mine drainage metagenome]|uniref:methylated-DNA--[protein]-cysteine S-methyltransferase n=1 Tax=mine drainage metagenome TaxID=410659 RepID=T1AQE8_9ZZZZ